MREVPLLTSKDWPVTAFSGVFCTGVVKRGSRHVPVQATGSCGELKCVSLYETSVRSDVLLPSMVGSQRVFQNISLPVKNARFTPASRAASTLARWPEDQYSS